MPTEITVLGWSVLLLLVHIMAQANTATRITGIAYNMSARDEPKPVDKLAGRFQRALRNYLETWPAFIALALALVVTNKAGGAAATAAWIWLICRVVYLVLYGVGVPVARTVIWTFALIALAVMFVQLMF